MEEQSAQQQAEGSGEQNAARRPATPHGSAEEESGKGAPLQRALAMAMIRSMEHYDDPELTRALRVPREEQRTRQHATARSVDPNDDPELTRALRALVEEKRTRQQTTARSMNPNKDPELTRALRTSIASRRSGSRQWPGTWAQMMTVS